MGALDGVRVLDLTRLLPGPYCTLLLADMGADVVKVEDPGGGDPARHYPPLRGDTGAVFLLVNRNKRSLTLNLKSDDGRELLLRLAERADVLVEGFRPGVMDRLGLGYAALRERNPRLIYATLSGFGQSGPDAQRPAHDLNYVALSGLLGFNADAQGRPVVPAVQVADLGGGALAAVGILGAVVARERTGSGQRVDTSLFGAAVSWLPTLFASTLGAGASPAPGRPPLAGGLPQYDIYATRDGRYVTLGALEPRFFQAFAAAVGRPDLVGLDTAGLRRELRELFASRSLAEWERSLRAVETCFAPVSTLDEAVHDPQADALGLFTSVLHPRLGQLEQIGPPFALSATPAGVRFPPPDLGEHTAAVLAEIGLTEPEVRALAARGVV
jgi:crotonobetainyl-CoA:carnitine CoA-transferase CaiB-like acyl-CoA transferase